jgi:mannose/fructose/N-acetylgalactosamine-specific phosphotransferase system component IID
VGNSLSARIVSYAILGLTAVLTTLINYVISYAVQILADMEQHKTKSNRMWQLILKTIITQFLNTCIIYSILYLIKPI